MLGYTFAGLGTLLFGVSWVILGGVLVSGRSIENSPKLNKLQMGQRRLVGLSISAFGLAMMWWGAAWMMDGVSYDVGQIKIMSGPLDCAEIVIYTMRGCPWCDKAKDELTKRGRAFKEVEFVRGNGKLPEVMPNGLPPRFFPQIWLNGRNVGGYSEMPSWIDNCKK